MGDHDAIYGVIGWERVKGHGHNSMHESVNSVGVIKSMCTSYMVWLESHTVAIKMIICIRRNIRIPTPVTVALLPLWGSILRWWSVPIRL